MQNCYVPWNKVLVQPQPNLSHNLVSLNINGGPKLGPKKKLFSLTNLRLSGQELVLEVL